MVFFIQCLLYFLLLFKGVLLNSEGLFCIRPAGVCDSDEPETSLFIEPRLMRPAGSSTELITDSGRITGSCLNRPRRRRLQEQRRGAVTVRA